MKRILVFIVLMSAMMSQTVFAVEQRQAERQTIQPVQDGLHRQVRRWLPQDLTTLREAVNYYLAPSGYRLTENWPAPEEARRLLDQRLLDHGDRRTLRVEEAILHLFEVEVLLMVDREAKLVSLGYGEATP